MTGIKSPTVRHRRLARELRRHRERAGLTTEAASDRLGWSRTKLVRFEAARTRPTPADVGAALDLYGADLPERAALMELARQARQRGWWTAYSDVFQSSFVALEDEASSIHAWHPQVIPGLLQTDAYAHAVISAADENVDRTTWERRLQARLARRALLSRPAAPTLHAVLDEAVIRRSPTTPGVMAEQLLSLVAAARRPNITLQVMPFSAGMHSGLDSGFVVLGYSEPEDPSVAYIETIGGELYVESSIHVDRITMSFERIRNAAWSPGESVAFIAATAKEVSRHGEHA